MQYQMSYIANFYDKISIKAWNYQSTENFVRILVRCSMVLFGVGHDGVHMSHHIFSLYIFILVVHSSKLCERLTVQNQDDLMVLQVPSPVHIFEWYFLCELHLFRDFLSWMMNFHVTPVYSPCLAFFCLSCNKWIDLTWFDLTFTLDFYSLTNSLFNRSLVPSVRNH